MFDEGQCSMGSGKVINTYSGSTNVLEDQMEYYNEKRTLLRNSSIGEHIEPILQSFLGYSQVLG